MDKVKNIFVQRFFLCRSFCDLKFDHKDLCPSWRMSTKRGNRYKVNLNNEQQEELNLRKLQCLLTTVRCIILVTQNVTLCYPNHQKFYIDTDQFHRFKHHQISQMYLTVSKRVEKHVRMIISVKNTLILVISTIIVFKREIKCKYLDKSM